MMRFIQVKNFGFSIDAVICWQRLTDEIGSPLVVNFQGDQTLKFTDEEAEQLHQILNNLSMSLTTRTLTPHRLEVA
ncbi:hypothetical protein PL8927_590001 [Planktothrix serta PCC 8927]|uniref:Uncharacterized protein n=1 Tax=Planktothrix serta PCC 8927 TaxID=671068 RepID=A0A7Z9BLY5_9CYAN|nr:hypothetical protein [Planktothrix serta]VXD17225.1 hypothetical protein PL8927_590001 [Planktothrix serta PCC 8927]